MVTATLSHRQGLHPPPFETERRRGHRIVGPLGSYQERRHYAVAGLIVAIVAAGVGAYAASEQSAAQEQAAKYNRRVTENQAQATRNAAAVAEDNQREHDRRVLAQQRALVGGAGLSTEGSALLVMIDSAKQAELDAVRIKFGGSQSAQGLEDQAGLFGFQGQQARRTGQVNVGTTLLTGASNAAGAYGRYKAPASTTPGYGGYGASPY